jgi:DNA-binding NtrC family response regulator
VSARSATQTPNSDQSTILYVEDEALLRLATTDELRAADFTVIEARTAAKAMAVAHGSTSLDVLMTDIRLPGPMNGLDLAERVRAARPGIRIVVASGHPLDSPVPNVVDAFFGKPYDVERVAKRIRELLTAS